MAEKTSPDMTTAQIRKIKKPIIERRRRERINESLNQLKALVLESLHKDESRYSKMEKADILDMTVKHLKSVQARQSSMKRPGAAEKYRAGFKDCAQEVSRYLSQESTSPAVQARIMQHLQHRIGSSGPSATQVLQPAVLPVPESPVGQMGVPATTAMTSLPGLRFTGVSPPSFTSSPVAAVPQVGMQPLVVLTSQEQIGSAIPLYISPVNSTGSEVMSGESDVSSSRASSCSPVTHLDENSNHSDLTCQVNISSIPVMPSMDMMRSSATSESSREHLIKVKQEPQDRHSAVWRPW